METEERTLNMDLAENEVSSGDMIYTRKKPTLAEISELREIKQRRKKQRIEDSEIEQPIEFKNESELKTEILKLGKIRGENREKQIVKIVDDFLILLKAQGRTEFSRGFLNSFVGVIKSQRKVQEITTNILEIMKKARKIREVKDFKRVHWLENKSLSSYDYGSFAILMKHKKNGCVSNGNKSLVLRSEPYVTVSYLVIETKTE